jgi:hypothetical protein
VSRLKSSLPESLAAAVKTTLTEWQSGGSMQRLGSAIKRLWTGDGEANLAGLVGHH